LPLPALIITVNIKIVTGRERDREKIVESILRRPV
jgi:hypothetical protein